MTTDFIITGIPRSGTSFACALLNRLPDVIALNETMDIQNLISAPSAAERAVILKSYLADVRNAIVTTCRMPHHELAGSRDNMFLSDTAGGRKSAKTGKLNLVEIKKPLPPSFTLALKNLNVFAMLLPQLRKHFDCCAVVRNPLATLASWHTLDHPLRQGLVLGAKLLDVPLASRLSEIEDDRCRRLALLDWYYQRFTEMLGTKNIQRYEDIVATNGTCLAETFPSAIALPDLLDAPLENHNQNALYGNATEAMVDAEALLSDRNHACWRVYPTSEVRSLLLAYKRRASRSGLTSNPSLS